MADVTSSIFNQKATEKLRSPDDLDKFVRVTTPSVWIAIAACVFLLAGLLAWGICGAVTTNLASIGIARDGVVYCYLTTGERGDVTVGDTATIEGVSCTVKEISTLPLSRNEVSERLNSDYLMTELIEGDWVYEVVFDAPTDGMLEGVPLDVSIETDRVAPISLILRNWG